MNLNIISNPSMAVITGEWIANPLITAAVTRHPLGASLWKEIQNAHQVVIERLKWRMSLEAKRAQIIALVTKLDGRHDRKARALHNLIQALIDATDDAELAEFLAGVYKLMFPYQLRIVHMSYFDEAGSAIELEARMTPEIERRLDTIRVGDMSLGDLYRDWIKTAKELGSLTQQRTRIEASLTVEGTSAAKTHTRKVRSVWIRAVRLLLDALDLIELSDEDREMLLSPLHRGIDEALARRAGNTGDIDLDDPDIGEPDMDDPDMGDPDVDAPAPGDDLHAGAPVTGEFPVSMADPGTITTTADPANP